MVCGFRSKVNKINRKVMISRFMLFVLYICSVE